MRTDVSRSEWKIGSTFWLTNSFPIDVNYYPLLCNETVILRSVLPRRPYRNTSPLCRTFLRLFPSLSHAPCFLWFGEPKI